MDHLRGDRGNRVRVRTLGSVGGVAVAGDRVARCGSDVGSRALAAAVGAATSGGLAAIGAVLVASGARFGEAFVFLGGFGVPIAALLAAVTAPGSIGSTTPAMRAFGLGIVAAELGNVELAAAWILAPEALGTTPPSAILMWLQLTYGTFLSLIAVPVTVPVLWTAIQLLRRSHGARRWIAWSSVVVALAIEALIVATYLATSGAGA